MTKAFYNKWRPGTWDEVVGQEHVVQTLKNAIRSDKVSHAYIFAGPRGTGKTTTARILAKAVNCLSQDPENRPDNTCDFCKELDNTKFLDLIEIDAASNTSVEDVRGLREKVNYAPSRGKFKVYIIDEAHMLSNAAFNALLKTLEEPPAHAIFILATTELNKVPATVLSRCQRYEFRRIPVAKMIGYLKDKSGSEGLNISEEALLAIARYATGSMRDAISLLDQLSSFKTEISLELVQTILGTAANQSVIDLVDSIIQGELANGFQVIRTAIDAGIDARQFSRQIVDYLRMILKLKAGDNAPLEITNDQKDTIVNQSRLFSYEELTDMVRRFNESASDTRTTNQPGLLLEIALTKAVTQKKDPTGNQAQPKENRKSLDENKPAQTPESESYSEVKPSPQEDSAERMSASIDSRDSSESSSDDPNRIISAWSEIGRAIKQIGKHQTSALLNSCKPMLKNGAVCLAFKSELLKDKMEAGDHLTVTKTMIGQICKVEIEVTCSVVDNEILPLPENIDGSGMVGTAINHGGKIINK